MEGVKDIIFDINLSLNDSFTKNGIKAVEGFGLADAVVSGNQTFPVFFQGNNGEWAGFDDRKNLIYYHKLNNVSTSENKGYGDNMSVTNKFNASLVIFYKKDILKLDPDELFAFIQAVIPETLKGEKFNYIRTSVYGAILNSQQVFSQEYKGITFSLKPEQGLISISYYIEGRFKKGCFNCCS